MVAADPYQLLGVQRTATTVEVVLAHGRLAAVFDPDRWSASPNLELEAKSWAEMIDEALWLILQGR